jgi:SAM-dependent methyltransferase
MHDWIDELAPGQLVLDLGAGAGSLGSYKHSGTVVSVDCDWGAFDQAREAGSPVRNVVAAGESLPFASSTFDLVLCHHVLEHVSGLAESLGEISRVLKPAGRLYVAVPNGYGLCDAIYRYIFEGGEHVNRFRKDELTGMLERSVGVRLTSWQKLYSSFAYLARLKDLDPSVLPKLPARLRRIALVPAGLVTMAQGSLYIFTRLTDLVAGADWALYGWALYFERSKGAPVAELPPYVNVCLYCGAAHPAFELTRRYSVMYRCPDCNHRGIYFPPFRGGQ